MTALTMRHREVEEQAAKLEQAPESLSAALTPLAGAMAALTEETKETLRLVVQQSRQGHQAALASVKQSTEQASAASKALQSRLRRLKTLAERLRPVGWEKHTRDLYTHYGPSRAASAWKKKITTHKKIVSIKCQ